MKQPAGPTRVAVRAADYMDNALILIKSSLGSRQKRSINATGVCVKNILFEWSIWVVLSLSQDS